jgi:hypothetical protein
MMNPLTYVAVKGEALDCCFCKKKAYRLMYSIKNAIVTLDKVRSTATVEHLQYLLEIQVCPTVENNLKIPEYIPVHCSFPVSIL